MKRVEADLWLYEREMQENGYSVICGVDEAGRGPLAGPVCAAAVILPFGLHIEGMNDSKKLTEKQRKKLFPIIQEKALAWSVAFGTVEEIESINILNATLQAMEKAVKGLSITPEIALIDGNKAPSLEIPVRTIVKGDSLSASIAAASVLAKVTRDRLLYEYDKTYPEYGFAAHKGYGTAAHIAAIRQNGACPIHRYSFIKKFLP